MAAAVDNKAIRWLGDRMARAAMDGGDRDFKPSEELFHVALREGIVDAADRGGNLAYVADEVEFAVRDPWRIRKSPASVQRAWIDAEAPRWADFDAFARDESGRFNAGSVDLLLRSGPYWLFTELKRMTESAVGSKNAAGIFKDVGKLSQFHAAATRELYRRAPGGKFNSKIVAVASSGDWGDSAKLVGAAVAICDGDSAVRLRERVLRDVVGASDGRVLVSDSHEVADGHFSLLLCLVPLSMDPSGESTTG